MWSLNRYELQPEDKDPDFSAPGKKTDKMESLHKELEAAKERLNQVKADVRQQEKPAGFFGKLNSSLVNGERIAEARHQVRMAKEKIKLAKAKAKADAEYERYLKSSGIDGFGDESEDDWDEEDED